MEDIVLLRQQLALKRAQLDAAKRFGLLHYKPHTKQERFHAAADFRFRLVRAGNRFGKSDCGVGEDLAFALGERPWYPKDHPLRYHGIPERPTKGLVIAADDDKIDEIFTGNGSKGHVGKIWKKLPKDLIVGTKRSSSGTITNMRIKGKYGESVIDFDTRSAFKNNPMGAESSDFDWCHIDEPIEEAHWKAILRGLTDRMGKAWFTCTLIEQPWINDKFFPTLVDAKKEVFEQCDPDTGRKIHWSITGSIFDNPYLSQEAIDDFLNSLTDDERACRISGIPLHLAGLVYKEFDYAKHVLTEVPRGWQNYATPPPDATIYVAIDPHPRTPHAVLLIAVTRDGRAYLYDEIFMTGTPQELAAVLKPKLENRNVICRKLDPSAFTEDQRTKQVFADDLAAAGCPGFERGSKDLQRGILACKHALKQPDFLYVCPTLRTFLWEISRYAWADKNGVPVNQPVDKDDHMLENFRRLVLSNLIYVDFEKISTVVPDEEFGGLDLDDFGSLSLAM